MKLMRYFHISLFLAVVTLVFTNCRRDKFCDFELPKSDVLIYQKLSKDIYRLDLSMFIQENIVNDIYKANFDKLENKPISSGNWKTIGNVYFLLKKQKTWYMETDYLKLIVSIDSSNVLFKYDDTDKQFRLNCQENIADNMILRSITVEN